MEDLGLRLRGSLELPMFLFIFRKIACACEPIFASHVSVMVGVRMESNATLRAALRFRHNSVSTRPKPPPELLSSATSALVRLKLPRLRRLCHSAIGQRSGVRSSYLNFLRRTPCCIYYGNAIETCERSTSRLGDGMVQVLSRLYRSWFDTPETDIDTGTR